MFKLYKTVELKLSKFRCKFNTQLALGFNLRKLFEEKGKHPGFIR